MNIRFDHAIVILCVLACMLIFVYLLDSVFKKNFDSKFNKFDSEFKEIERSIKNKDYQKALVLSSQIVDKSESGTNEIRAKSYLGISQLELGQGEKASRLLEQLISKYPGIKMVYSDLYLADKGKDNISFIYSHILNEYIESTKEAIDKEMTLMDILDSMDRWDWGRLILILSGSLFIYERVAPKLRS